MRDQRDTSESRDWKPWWERALEGGVGRRPQNATSLGRGGQRSEVAVEAAAADDEASGCPRGDQARRGRRERAAEHRGRGECGLRGPEPAFKAGEPLSALVAPTPTQALLYLAHEAPRGSLIDEQESAEAAERRTRRSTRSAQRFTDDVPVEPTTARRRRHRHVVSQTPVRHLRKPYKEPPSRTTVSSSGAGSADE